MAKMNLSTRLHEAVAACVTITSVAITVEG